MYIPSGGTSFWEAITNGIRAIASAQRLLDITHASGITTITGADATGDDLYLKVNDVNDYPAIRLKGNSNLELAYYTQSNLKIYSGSTMAFFFNSASNLHGFFMLEANNDPTAVANMGCLFTKADNKLYFIDGAGTKHEVAFV